MCGAVSYAISKLRAGADELLRDDVENAARDAARQRRTGVVSERPPLEEYEEADASRCPLCGDPNACALIQCAAYCWCFDVDIRPEVMEQVPLEAAGKSCLCRACAGGAHLRRGVLIAIRDLLQRRRA